MSTSQSEISRFAERLLARLGDPEPFRTDTAAAVSERFGITVSFRHDVDTDCDIDGSYDHDRRHITCAAAASVGRRRFTILHELGHALGHSDGELADWLFNFPDTGRLEEERVGNAFASAVLLPEGVVAEHIPADGPSAFDVVRLANAVTASRAAVCVRAAQRLKGPGLVALVQGSVVQFTATRSLPFGIGRHSDQGPDSFFARASKAGQLREDRVRVRFPSGAESSTLMGDAYGDGSGYTFVVLMEHSAPWAPLTAVSDGPDGFEIDCELCDSTRITFGRECRVCGDRPCPDHGCSCSRRRPANARRCRGCNLELPLGVAAEVEYCDLCG